MTIGSLCTGIGALDLGLLRAGLGPVLWQVEIDDFCNRILERHFPHVERHRDVCAVGSATLAPVDLVCGGFPCQPASVAGRQKGEADHRWLWPEFKRIIDELRPKRVLLENVLGLRTRGLRTVLADLASLGFDAEWCDFGAVEVGAPHWRRRFWIVGTDTDGERVQEPEGWLAGALRAARKGIDRAAVETVLAADPDGVRRLESALELAKLRGWSEYCGWAFDPTPGVHDGVARGLAGPSRKAAGNAVVVACAEAVGRAIATRG